MFFKVINNNTETILYGLDSIESYTQDSNEGTIYHLNVYLKDNEKGIEELHDLIATATDFKLEETETTVFSGYSIDSIRINYGVHKRTSIFLKKGNVTTTESEN